MNKKIFDSWFEEPFQKDCDNCKWMEIEGGDVVPYGSTTATMPDYEVCNADIPEDKQTDEYYESIMHNPDCPYWEMRHPSKNVRLF